MSAEVVQFPNTKVIYPLENMLEDMRTFGVDEVFIIGRDPDGEVLIFSTVSAQDADDLLDDGIDKWEELLEYEDDDAE